MTVSGRIETIANGWSGPEAAIRDGLRQCRLTDRKAYVAYEEIIVRRSSQ